MKQLNIILIMADNQPADLLGCYGNDEVRTPHLDALAARGTRYANAYCVNAMCSPCRASVLTGLMPSQHGIHNWLDDRLVDRWPQNWSAIGEFSTLPQRLHDAGYDTALIGKFHLGVPDVPQLGFDRWVTFPHGHTTSFYGNEVIDGDRRYRVDGHTVDFFTDRTVDYIRGRGAGDAPFFAFVPFNGPYGHWPAIDGRGPDPFADLYDSADMHSIPREPINTRMIDRLAQRVLSGGLREQFKGPFLLMNNVPALRNYLAQISLIDHCVGRILAAVDALPDDRETVIVYTADHGFALGHNGIWGHGAAAFPASAHRASYHIPLIVAGGGFDGGGVAAGLATQLDLFPTLAALGGADPVPDQPSPARDLAGSDAPDAVFYEQEETRAVRSRDWLCAARVGVAPSYSLGHALYDLRADPEERMNLASDPAHAATLADMLARITAFFEKHSAPRYDLWSGGTAKSNVTFDGLWRDAWGPDWRPEFS